MPKPRKSKRHPLYPEPGAWVLGNTKGMPEVLPPKEVLASSPKLEAHEIRDAYISYEGLGYCIYHYVPVSSIADSQLAKLWRTAREAMQEVVEYLEEVPEPVERNRRTLRGIER